MTMSSVFVFMSSQAMSLGWKSSERRASARNSR